MFKSRASKKSMAAVVVDEAGYPILVIIALWASAVTTQWTEQFLTVAIILGWKWICGNQTQVIQIFTNEEKDYK
jgi:hypothetical protein